MKPELAPAIQRLGKNQGRYCGETIQIQRILNDIQTAAMKGGWRSDCLLEIDGYCIRTYHRRSAVSPARKRLYLSSGIHGDEPAGPLAVLELLEKDRWPESIDVWLCPCLNPTGYALNRRENIRGIDLNRDYREPTSEETRSHVAWLAKQPTFDLSVFLHEDWEANGFYLYELNPDRQPSLAEKIIERVAEVMPIESAELVDGWPARGGIIRPNVAPEERPQWPEAVFLIHHKTRQTYTLETPSDFPLRSRVAAHVVAVRTILESMAA